MLLQKVYFLSLLNFFAGPAQGVRPASHGERGRGGGGAEGGRDEGGEPHLHRQDVRAQGEKLAGTK